MAESKPTPRPAATVLLLREAEAAPEVFMLQRTAKAVFLPGAYVFPGGALDRTTRAMRAGPACAQPGRCEGECAPRHSRGRARYWVAAARECFEESGILLAVDEKDLPVDPGEPRRLRICGSP
jgi:8-oxo-dGTP pyrophosphatase MutT (NUDIX family)